MALDFSKGTLYVKTRLENHEYSMPTLKEIIKACSRNPIKEKVSAYLNTDDENEAYNTLLTKCKEYSEKGNVINDNNNSTFGNKVYNWWYLGVIPDMDNKNTRKEFYYICFVKRKN